MAGTTEDLFTDEPRIEGETSEHRPNDFASSKAAEGSMRFGRALMKGTGDNQVKVMAGVSAEFVGISNFSKDASLEDPDEPDNPLVIGYVDGESVGNREHGVINVRVNEAISIGDPVRVVTDDNGVAKDEGAFTTTAVAGKTATVSGLRFASETTGEGVVQLEIEGTIGILVVDDT